MNMQWMDSFEWRYACKKMNGQSVPQEKIDSILQAIRLAPTSMGLQPFTVLVITDLELRKKIQPVAFNQSQITDSSHLLVFAAWSSITEDKIREYVANAAHIRNTTTEALKGLSDMLTGALLHQSDEQNFNWAARQAYIALGFGLAAAAMVQVDATPMEGFQPGKLDELLELPAKGLRSVSMLALGYRDAENDWLVNLAKVRRQPEQLFIHY
jgi:nitroreductase